MKFPVSQDELFRRCRLFENFSRRTQLRIIRNSIKNDLRGLDLYSLTKRRSPFLNSKPAICFAVLVKTLQAGLSGFCPTVHFCFDSWITDPFSDWKPHDDALDISTHYLYRIPAWNIAWDGATILGEGAYSKVWIDPKSNNIAVKTPRNIAGLEFALAEEARLLELSMSTPLVVHAPKLDSFDVANGYLRREHIRGVSGHDLLKSRSNLTLEQLELLEQTFEAAKAFETEIGVFLDLHPGNFIWDWQRQNWVLIDFGRAPRIAANYCPRQDFSSYFSKVWAQRINLMETHPIRSLALSL